MPEIRLHDPCLCGSGIITSKCCLRNCRPKRDRTRTGYSHSRCYAKSLNDCSKKISKEHFVSEGVLKLIDDPIMVRGFPWLDRGEAISVPTKDLASKILCERHNHSLSGLDKVGIRLFKSLIAMQNEIIVDDFINLFHGDMVELWMLKTLCGIISSGNAIDQSGRKIEMIIPTHWLNMLFKEQRPIVNCGLYMPHRIDHVFHRENPIEIRMITDGPLIKGFVIALQALDFTFIADELPRMRMLTLVNNCTYRPGQIEIENPGGTRIISIQWPNPGDSRRIVIGPNHI